MPVAPKASAARAMAPAFPGSCKPSSTTTSAEPRNNCSSRHTGGCTSAITPWLVSVPETLCNKASGNTTTFTPARRRTCASAADRTDSAASTVFTSQSLRSASSSRWKVSATHHPCEVRLPRAMARRTSFSSGFAALVIVSGFAI